MTGHLQLQLAKLPSIWANYPRVVLVRRPPITEVTEPPEIVASVPGVMLDADAVARYAQMCGFGATATLPVTFPHVLAMPLHLKIFGNGAFPLRPMGLIHLSNVIESLGELTAGSRVDITVAARNYQRTDAGLVFDMATEISSGGRPLWRETCVFLSRWPEDMLRQGGRPPRPPKAPKDSAVLAELDVSLRTAWAYARVAADYNPIHLSDRAARFLGLRGSIGHGMWSLARSLAQAPVPVIPHGVRIETQFLTPVQLPARVAIKEWRAEGQVKRALCDIRTGRVHMVAWWDDVIPA
ncbi:MAG: MaoC-like protein [Pseudomonadota bacterium]|nr:MaoC-like protein [Pseudomonadota bacterium]